MIDFPQMVSVSHQNAQMYVMSLVSGSCLCLLFSFSVPFSCFVYGFFFFSVRYFDRDIECIFKFFRKRLVTNWFIYLYIIFTFSISMNSSCPVFQV